MASRSRSPEETAGYAAIAAALAAILAVILVPGYFTLRSAAALVIGAPAAVLLGFYAMYKEAEDRLYKVGLLTLIVSADLVVAGIPLRVAAAIVVGVILVLVVALAFRR